MFNMLMYCLTFWDIDVSGERTLSDVKGRMLSYANLLMLSYANLRMLSYEKLRDIEVRNEHITEFCMY